MTRISNQGADKKHANLSAKKLIQMKNQGLIKNPQLIQQQALKPLYL
jgi:hypothetical protein